MLFTVFLLTFVSEAMPQYVEVKGSASAISAWRVWGIKKRMFPNVKNKDIAV